MWAVHCAAHALSCQPHSPGELAEFLGMLAVAVNGIVFGFLGLLCGLEWLEDRLP